MKVLTLNCHAWQEENQMEKIKHLAQVMVGVILRISFSASSRHSLRQFSLGLEVIS